MKPNGNQKSNKKKQKKPENQKDKKIWCSDDYRAGILETKTEHQNLSAEDQKQETARKPQDQKTRRQNTE